MGKRAKNHHIVPQTLQKYFVVEGDPRRIWRAKRDEDGVFLPPERKLLKKALFIKDYNTVLDDDEYSDRVERHFYGGIDDYLGRMLPTVIDLLRNGQIPSFTHEALKDLREVVMHMTKRTPDFLGDFDDIELGKDFIQSLLDKLPNEASSSEREGLLAELSDQKRLLEVGRSIRVNGTIRRSERVENVLAEYTPRWSVSETRHSYILSSRMVYFIGNGGRNGLVNPSCELWMPIEPKIALVMVRDPQNRIPQVVVDTPQHIRTVNQFAAKRSFEIASHSEKLIKSLTGY